MVIPVHFALELVCNARVGIEDVKCLEWMRVKKKRGESGISDNTYCRVDFIHAEARIQICEWCD